MRRIFQQLVLALFCVYLALFPGSTLTVALDRVPAWGLWMGGALLMLQGAIVLCWLIGSYGRRGALAALLLLLLAWGVEHVGVTTGAPFGRYSYTAQLQPQLLGVVPLAIICAWLMVAVGSWQLATSAAGRTGAALLAATLIVLLDLQIETVATAINRYWVWLSDGPYYGVPTANFVSWWLVGVVMTLLVVRILRPYAPAERPTMPDGRLKTGDRPVLAWLSRRVTKMQQSIPAYLYILSTVMFTVVNLARGYHLAGAIGIAVLVTAAISAYGGRRLAAGARAARQTPD